MGCVVMTLHRSKLIVIGNEYSYGIIDKVHTVHDSVTSVFSPCRPEQGLLEQANFCTSELQTLHKRQQ